MFNQINVDQALAAISPTDIKQILVVGSGEGADVIALRNRLGPRPLIVGVDIDIHTETLAKIANTLTIRSDITVGDMIGTCFDLAYSFATFEHIRDLKKGWQNMINMLNPGGFIWCVSSPLWHSPFGHHKPIFNNHPWIHLEHPSPGSLLEHCKQNSIQSGDEIDIIHHINYLFNPNCFNMLPGSAYIEAANDLNGVHIEINELDNLSDAGLEAPLERLMELGHKRPDLLGQTHTLAARRI